MNDAIKAKLAAIPDSPGVYFMKDAAATIIYIGKAKSLTKRVSSYFHRGGHDPKTEFLVQHIADIDYIAVKSEVEALILEAELIKKHTPRFNIDLKDNKSYPFIKITDEKFPRIIKTRTVTKDGRYFGPYVGAAQANAVLDCLERLYPIRTCNRKAFRINRGICLNHHIGKCRAPCEGRITEEEYRRFIDEAALLLEGKTDDLVKTLTAEMEARAKAMEFERAKELRDRIAILADIAVEQNVYVPLGGDADAFGIYGRDGRYAAVVLLVRLGKLIDKKSYRLAGCGSSAEVLNEFIKKYYFETHNVAPNIYLPETVEDESIIAEWLSDIAGMPVAITAGFIRKIKYGRKPVILSIGTHALQI
jgi:excinuclease ABC subunit C